MARAITRTLPLLFAACRTAAAQQAIVNMPSADITPNGKHFCMHETQMRSWGQGQYWYGANFYAYGVGKSTELTVTNWNARKSRDAQITFGQKLIFGHRGQGLGGFSYAHVSLRLPRLNTRVTGGGWAGTKALFERNTGNVLVGIEQPLDRIVAAYKIPDRLENGRHGLVLEYGFFF